MIKSRFKSLSLTLAAMSFAIVLSVLVLPGMKINAEDIHYTRDAVATEDQLNELPGVYYTVIEKGEVYSEESPKTIGIPSIAKQKLTLENGPTKESPAIIMGAAVGFEKKTGPTDYEILNERIAPYSYFRYGIIDEEMRDADGNITVHKKLSGFDGSYYIVRINLTNLLDGITEPEKKFLHVKQEDNKALMVAVGFDGTTYCNQGNKTGSYPLKDALAALKDTTGNDMDTPYFDVVILSSGKLVAGADAGDGKTPEGDIKLSFYVDETADYHPGLVELDPNNMPTFPHTCKPDGEQGPEVTYQTETDYNNALFTKFYEDEEAKKDPAASSYLVKGSDLEIDVTVDESDEQASSSTPPVFWSLEKAMAYQAFDKHVIKLICEVPVLDALSISGTSERNVILDVNSFDIQIANNVDKKQAGLTIDANANLTIMDGTNTSGAELAVGNNATMVIKKDGVLIIDESCTTESEYDAGTVPEGETPPDLDIGEITIEDGGKIINNGVINIEGAESKPKDPSQQDTPVVTDVKRADMFVNYGGQLDNNGCISLKGDLYVLGTLNNNGKYDDTIDAHDPDKGTTSYHKGIQVTWKDVVTDEGIDPGVLNVGLDSKNNVEKRAILNNKGDIVLVPGTFNLYGTFNNEGNLYLCTVTEAIIPVINPDDPLEVERRVSVNPPRQSVFNANGGTVNDHGYIGEATVELIHNGVLGKLTRVYTVTFNSGAGSKVEAQKVKLGDKAKKPIDPTYNGYDFGGWYKEAECKNAWDFDKDIVDKNVTLYAKWTQKEGTKVEILAPSKKLAVNTKITLKAKVTPDTAATNGVTWKISNAKYGKISSKGVLKLTNKAKGKKVKITATAKDGSNVQASITVKGMSGAVKKIKVNGKKEVKAGKSIKLKAKVTASKGSNKAVKWTSSNTKYAKVTSKGKVTAKKAGKGKTVKITATATDGTKHKATKKIKIK